MADAGHGDEEQEGDVTGVPAPLAVGTGVAAVVAHPLVGGAVGLALTVVLAVTAVAVIGASLSARPPDHRRAWWALAASIAVFAAGTVAARWAALEGVSSPAALPLHCVGYALFLGAEMHLARVRRGGRALADLIDLTVIAAAGSVVAWRVLWMPARPDETGLFFFGCVLALGGAVGARVLLALREALATDLAPESALPSVLLLASFYPVTVAGAASVCGLVDGGTGTWLGAAWPATALLLVTAVRRPAVSSTSRPADEVEAPVDRWRLYLIGAATPVPLVVGLVTKLDDTSARFVFAVGIIINAMVTVRTGLAFHRTTRELDGRIAAEAELAQQARFDTLTGLPNRALFTTRLEEAIARADAEGRLLAVLYLDLDRFKVVNDSFGTVAGDEVLGAVADRLRASVRDHDTPARLSGDEFAVILEQLAGPEDAWAVAERIREAVREPVAVAGTTVLVGTSIGLSLYDEPGQATDLLREADVALSDAKQRGRNAVVAFDAGLREQITRALAFEHDLVSAVERGELRLHYQPQIDLATNRVSGVEALIRWQHPTQGLLGPAAFIDIAEATGLIVPIGGWVIDEACRQHRRWQAQLGAEAVPHIAVNVSPTQLVRDDVAGRIRRALAATRLDALQLHVEITEVALLGDSERAVQALDAIEAQGVAIAVDDFGTGYFSLSHLRRFPVHRIKIDRSFVAGIGASGEDEAIIDATVDLAHSLGLSVVAEGVETAEQLAYLHRRGCDVVQGYLFARPLPPDGLAAFLKASAERNGVAAPGAPDRHREMAPITTPVARSRAAGEG